MKNNNYAKSQCLLLSSAKKFRYFITSLLLYSLCLLNSFIITVPFLVVYDIFVYLKYRIRYFWTFDIYLKYHIRYFWTFAIKLFNLKVSIFIVCDIFGSFLRDNKNTRL